MAVTLRLSRTGKKGNPSYRIVAIDKRKKRNGTYVDIVGSYHPIAKTSILNVDQKKVQYWVEKGAVLSEALKKLFKKNPISKRV